MVEILSRVQKRARPAIATVVASHSDRCDQHGKANQTLGLEKPPEDVSPTQASLEQQQGWLGGMLYRTLRRCGANETKLSSRQGLRAFRSDSVSATTNLHQKFAARSITNSSVSDNMTAVVMVVVEVVEVVVVVVVLVVVVVG